MGIFNIFKGSDKKSGKSHETKANFIDDEWVEVSATSREEAVERACTALNATESHLEIKWLSKDGKKLRARKGSPQSKPASDSEKKTGTRNRKTGPKKQQTQGGRGGQRNVRNRDEVRDEGRDGNRNGNRNDNRNESRNDGRNDTRSDGKETSARGRGGQKPRSTSAQKPEQDNKRQARSSRDQDHDREDRYRDDEDQDFNRKKNYDQDDRDNRNNLDNRDRSDRSSYNDDYQSMGDTELRDDHEEFEEEFEEETSLGLDAREFLTKLVQYIDKPATVELYETNKTVRLEIESEESGLFIGKHGQTLDSIQHVMMKIFKEDDNPKFMVVDAEDYRVRREENLENKARKLAKKARKERRPVGVEPMNAIDRRIVHLALRGEPGVETKSIGEGSNRRVLIVPKGMDNQRGGRGGGGRDRDQSSRRSSSDRDGNQAPRREKEYEGPSRGGSSDSGGFDDYDY